MDRYDLIVIGSGPGGASVVQRLASSGKRILLLERGSYLHRSRDNWSAQTVFVDAAYQTSETWYDSDGKAFHPGLHYFVGRNSKVYGAALFRLREHDFDEVRHEGGVSPAWPLKYDVFEPYYDQAEGLFQVHGQRGEDPNEPWASGAYPFAAVKHEPRIQQLSDNWAADGLHPFHLPLGVLLDADANGDPLPSSRWFRNDAFDGFPCLLNGKADAQVICVDPVLAAHANVTLLTGAYVARLETDASVRTVSAVQVTRAGREERYAADVVVVACGALSSALLLLRSASERHPNGLANGSGQVGRNYMRHNQWVLMALAREPNDTVFQKTLGLSDFYFGAAGSPYPLGLIQMMGKSHADEIRAEALPSWLAWFPDMPFELMARHSVDFWLMSEDLPRPRKPRPSRSRRTSRARPRREQPAGACPPQGKARAVAPARRHAPGIAPTAALPRQGHPIGGTAHQAGTARFGTDPASSALDLDCKAHDFDNLYLADASFFPSIGTVNPTLTIIANALRVADCIGERLDAVPAP